MIKLLDSKCENYNIVLVSAHVSDSSRFIPWRVFVAHLRLGTWNIAECR